jgi:phosphatidylglycerol:prolipoprotein diacylglycerol transferase
MRQVLFRIPLKPFAWLPEWWPQELPIYGFGAMLFVTFLVTTWMASRRAQKRGIAPQYLQDLAIWIFLCGVIGARLVFMAQYGVPLSQFFRIWDGGLVFYGSAVGGVIGFLMGYVFIIRKHHISLWQLADIIAPCIAIGLLIGRVGCLLNGCCYGNVATCEHYPAIEFPLSAPPRYKLVDRGYQSAAGFVMVSRESADQRVVAEVMPGSPAEKSGLRAGDLIVRANDVPIERYTDLYHYLGEGDSWPRGENDLSLTVRRDGTEVKLPPFAPRTLGLHPTQIYESISMALLYLVLVAFEPFRRRDGMVMVLFILGYSLHRFLNEMLRNDTANVFDTGMTLSQNGSIFFFVVGLALLAWLCRTNSGRAKPVPV